MNKVYRHQAVTTIELEALRSLARAEERAFFDRNPQLVDFYRERLIATALCQGAALQYLGLGYGVNDFDVHFFYLQNPQKPRLSRTVKRIAATVGSFRNVPVDFVRTVVPIDSPQLAVTPATCIRRFLEIQPTANATHIAKKAVIGLDPLFGERIWPAV